ncbi:unnamed protein product, partial [Rotaria magnacalcarata]
QSAKLIKLNDRLIALTSQNQPQIPPKSSLHRQLPSNIPSRHSPSSAWSSQDLHEAD